MVQKSLFNYVARKDAETAASNAPILSHIRIEPHPTSAEGNLQLLQSITERVHPDGTVERVILNYGVGSQQVGRQQVGRQLEGGREAPIQVGEKRERDSESTVRCRQQFSFAQRWRLLQLADANGFAYVERTKHVPHGTLSAWNKSRKEIEQAVARGLGHQVKIQPLAVYKVMFAELYDAYVAAREMFFAVTLQWARGWCCAKSVQFSNLPVKRQYDNLQTFKRHFNLSVRRTCCIHKA